MSYTKHARGYFNKDIPRGSRLRLRNETLIRSRTIGVRLLLHTFLGFCNLFCWNACMENAEENGSCHIKCISIVLYENGKSVLYYIFILFVFLICKKFFSFFFLYIYVVFHTLVLSL